MKSSDDLELNRSSISPELDEAVEVLDKYLATAMGWMKARKLSPVKREMLWLSGSLVL